MKSEHSYFRVSGVVLFIWLAFAPLAEAYYNPSAGRWLNRVPFNEQGHRMATKDHSTRKKPTTEDVYRFAHNAPVGKFDPDGRWVVPVVGGGIGIGLGWCLDRFALCPLRVAAALRSAESEADAHAPDGTTHREGANPTEGGDADALTHCIAGCNLARTPYPCFGPDGALEELQRRELGNAIGTQLDRLNNENGIAVGMSIDSDQSCRTGCLDALRRGLLNEIQNGVIVPSSE